MTLIYLAITALILALARDLLGRFERAELARSGIRRDRGMVRSYAPHPKTRKAMSR